MSVDTRPVPTTLLRWPRTRDLITQQKFILMYLWPNPDQTACGCYLLGIESTAADLSMTSSSLVDALGEFVRRGLVEIDKKTGELFIVDWFRFYQPRSNRARWAVEAAISKIFSTELREKVQNAYKSAPQPTKEKEKEKEKEAAARKVPQAPSVVVGAAALVSTSTPTPRRRRGDQNILHGVVVWTGQDEAGVLALVNKHGVHEVAEVAARLKPPAGASAPYLSAVVAALQEREARAARDAAVFTAAAATAAAPPLLDAEAARANLARAKAAMLGEAAL